jgi:hypothetical protein
MAQNAIVRNNPDPERQASRALAVIASQPQFPESRRRGRGLAGRVSTIFRFP